MFCVAKPIYLFTIIFSTGPVICTSALLQALNAADVKLLLPQLSIQTEWSGPGLLFIISKKTSASSIKSMQCIHSHKCTIIYVYYNAVQEAPGFTSLSGQLFHKFQYIKSMFDKVLNSGSAKLISGIFNLERGSVAFGNFLQPASVIKFDCAFWSRRARR